MLRTAISLLVALCAATVVAQEGTPPPLPAPGRLIDVGGWRLHLNCTGPAGGPAPTVILEPGIGDFSVEWSLVQPLVASHVRVCSYDRAGDGWSDLGPHPRTFKQIVYELHTLLERANEKPPFVLAGQSYGGWLVRLYQFTYPDDVAGLVLVDAGEDDPERLTPAGTVRSSTLVSGKPIPPIQTSGPLRVEDIPPPALAAMRSAIAATRDRANDPPRDKLPEDAKKMRAWAQSQLGHLAAGVNPVEIEELALLRAAGTAQPTIYGDMPLVVITRGRPDSDDTPERIASRLASHKAIANRSRRGKHLIAERSGHHVQIEQPDLVVGAIQEVVSAVRSMAMGSVASLARRPAQDQKASETKDRPRRMADGREWTTLNLAIDTVQSFCYDDAELNCGRYGRLYTWESARRGCQALGAGWRLPTDDEWRQMAKHYGGIFEDSDDKGKAAYSALLTGGSSEFKALLGGGRNADDGQYARLEAHGFYWTASKTDPVRASFYNFGRGGSALYRQSGGDKRMALSVRCVRE